MFEYQLRRKLSKKRKWGWNISKHWFIRKNYHNHKRGFVKKKYFLNLLVRSVECKINSHCPSVSLIFLMVYSWMFWHRLIGKYGGSLGVGWGVAVPLLKILETTRHILLKFLSDFKLLYDLQKLSSWLIKSKNT